MISKILELFIAWNVHRHERAIEKHQQKRMQWLRLINHPADVDTPETSRHATPLESVYREEDGHLVYREGCFEGARTRVLRNDERLDNNFRLEELRQEAGSFEDTRPQLLRLCEAQPLDIDLSSALSGIVAPADRVGCRLSGDKHHFGARV